MNVFVLMLTGVFSCLKGADKGITLYEYCIPVSCVLTNIVSST